MHFRPLYLVIGLLTVIHAAPFPTTDGANNDGNFTSKDLNIRTEPTSKSQPLHSRIFVTVTHLGTRNKPRPIPEVIKARIAAYLNGIEEEFIQSPIAATQIEFEPRTWTNAGDPAITAFWFDWWHKDSTDKKPVHLDNGEWGVMGKAFS